MCGIAGFAESASAPAPWGRDAGRDLLHRMCEVIRHRGPDDEGLLVEAGPHDGIALGMRRLSIIDLSTGHQPIHNEDRTVWIVFNGEIYNFRELRQRLARRHQLGSRGDTETIVHLYEEHGVDCLQRLDGKIGRASCRERV